MFLTVVTLLAGFCAAFYLYMTRNHNFFASRGVAQVPPVFPWGSETHKKMASREISFVSASEEIYQQYKSEKMVGHYEFGTPRLLAIDLELIKNIMIKDFDHFTDRRSVSGLNLANEVNRIQMSMMTMLQGEKWKLIRSIYSPIFTSGKLKAMTGYIHKSSDKLSKKLASLANGGEEFSAKTVMSDFTMDVIATCGFGLESGAFSEDGDESSNEFRHQSAELLGLNKRGVGSVFRLLTILSFPALAKALKLTFLRPEPVAFFDELVRSSIRQRRRERAEGSGVRRNDLIDLALDALEKAPDLETVEDDQFEKDAQVKPEVADRRLPEEELELMLVANAMQMFMAGYETTSTILSMALYHLAKNPSVQERLRQEVEDHAGSGDNKDFDYNTLQNKLPYLDAVLKEASRSWPLTVVERECVKDYKVPGTDFVIPKGMLVQLPTMAIMQDSRHFGAGGDPLRFDPDNFFDPSRRDSRSPYAFLSFGQGPRNCVGMRFAMMTMKAVLARMVRDGLELVASERTAERLEVDPLSPTNQPKGGIWLKVKKRN